MWWWVWAAVLALLLAAYLAWLAARVNRLHRRAETAASALEAALVRRAAATAVLADELTTVAPGNAADLYAVARAALDADPYDREAVENDLTKALRRLCETQPDPASGWPAVVTASRRLSLARHVHSDVVRDALAVRRRPVVRAFQLARRYDEPVYFDVDPELPLSAGDVPA